MAVASPKRLQPLPIWEAAREPLASRSSSTGRSCSPGSRSPSSGLSAVVAPIHARSRSSRIATRTNDRSDVSVYGPCALGCAHKEPHIDQRHTIERVVSHEEEGVVILLGSYDSSVTPADRDAYLRQAAAISGGRGDQAAPDGSDKLSFAPHALGAAADDDGGRRRVRSRA